MRDDTVARNYAETLFELAEAHEGIEVYQAGIRSVAQLIDELPDFRRFLETPRIDAKSKKNLVREVLGDSLPKLLMNFLLITIDKRRQRLLGSIAREFDGLVDEKLGRAHVDVTLAREMTDEGLEEITSKLSSLLGVEAIPHIRVQPSILGGIVVRAGDTIYDGSLRRKLDGMRRRLMTAELPAVENA